MRIAVVRVVSSHRRHSKVAGAAVAIALPWAVVAVVPAGTALPRPSVPLRVRTTPAIGGSLWRTPNGYTDAANQNVGKKRAQGLDINVTHVLPVARGSLNLNLIGSYLIKAEIDTGLYTYDCVGLTGNTCNDPYSDHPAMQPKWRHLFRASWEKGSLTEQLKLNLADKYGVFNYVDLAVSQKVGRGIRWTIGVNNIFDKNPPLGSGSTANDYADGFYGTYDSYGRFIHTSVEFTF